MNHMIRIHYNTGNSRTNIRRSKKLFQDSFVHRRLQLNRKELFRDSQKFIHRNALRYLMNMRSSNYSFTLTMIEL